MCACCTGGNLGDNRKQIVPKKTRTALTKSSAVQAKKVKNTGKTLFCFGNL